MPQLPLGVDSTAVKAPCAIVPLKPNELRRPGHARWPTPLRLPPGRVRARTSTGMISPDLLVDTIEARCTFNLRATSVKASLTVSNTPAHRHSCVLATTTIALKGTSTRDARPAAAADASK